VGKAPSPFRSNKSLWVLGSDYPLSTMAEKVPAYEAMMVGLKISFTYWCSWGGIFAYFGSTSKANCSMAF
jgi:hypothetical protein